MLSAMISAVPWKMILTTAPAAVDSARLLYNGLKRRREGRASPSPTEEPDSHPQITKTIRQMRSRIDQLEVDSTRRAELISQLASQEEALARGLQAISARLTLLVWVSGAALVLATAAVVIAVVV